MNDTELDTLARSAAADVRCEAGRIADSQNALQVLLGDVDAARDEPAASDAEIIELDNVTPIRRRPIWLPLTAAAAMVAAIAGVVFLTNGSDEGPAVSTNPITIPVTTPVVVPDPEPAPITREPTITVEATPVEPTQPVDEGAVEASEGVIDVPDARGPQLERTVLASYEVGSGDGELGFEQCQECEPLTPWAPVVTDDGTVVVADALNGRWMIHRDGAWTSLPYRDGEVVTSAPVVGPDGLMYAMVADTFNQAAARHIVAYEPNALTEVASYPEGSANFLPLDLIDGNVTYSTATEQVTVTDFALPPSSASVNVIWSANEVEMSISGITRRFHLDEAWSLDAPATYSAPDGSVVAVAHAPTPDGTLETLLIRLWIDGSFSVGLVGPYGSSANNDETRFSTVGLVRLEDGEVVRYAWPEFTARDPLAGWVIPEFSDPSLDGVPYLVPSAPAPGAVVSERTEYADLPSSPQSMVQTWVRTDASTVVDGIVQITTKLGPDLTTATDEAVIVPGWDQAYFNASTPEVSILRLHTATRSAVVWTSGLDRDTTLQIAVSLTLDGDSVGWAGPSTEGGDRWIPIAEGWSSGTASRTFRQSVPDEPLMLELWTSTGAPDAIGAPGLVVSPETTMTVADVNGNTALVTDRGVNSAVVWQPEPEVLVLLGVDGSPDTALATARSITAVDRDAWLSSAIEQRGSGDGCDGMFC